MVGGVGDIDAPPAGVEDRSDLDGDSEFALSLVDRGHRRLFLATVIDHPRENAFEGGLLAENGLVGDEAVRDGDRRGVELGDEIGVRAREKPTADRHVDEALGLIGREPVAVQREGDNELSLAEPRPAAVTEGSGYGYLKAHDGCGVDRPTKRLGPAWVAPEPISAHPDRVPTRRIRRASRRRYRDGWVSGSVSQAVSSGHLVRDHADTAYTVGDRTGVVGHGVPPDRPESLPDYRGRRATRSERFKWLLGLSTGMKDQGRSTRKRTGGRLRPFRKKKRYQLGRQPAETTVGEPRFQTIDARGSEIKTRALATNVAHVAEGGETTEAEIENVTENPANTNYARRNIVTKGAIIETSAGRARVTSRPGQTGQVNAVLLD